MPSGVLVWWIPQIPVNTCVRSHVLKYSQKSMWEWSPPSWIRTNPLISFPDLLWTKPKARSGKVRKFVFLDWLLHLTPVQSPLWRSFPRKLSSNSSSRLEISSAGENEKPIRKDEMRKDLEVMCHSGLNNFCNMIVPLPKSQTRHPARAKLPSPTHAFTNPSPCSLFFALTRSPNLRTKTACGELLPEAF